MCGIFGYMNPDRAPDPAKLVELGLLASTRGTDATGMAWLQGGSIQSHRVSESLPDTEYDLWERALEANVMIGHCRFTTVGDRDAAPHPFVGRGVATAHNGTIWDHHKVADELDLKLKSDCDSEVLMRSIEKYRRSGATLIESMRETVKIVKPGSPIALLVVTPKAVGCYAKNYPLFKSRTGYFAQKLPTWGRWYDLSDGIVRAYPIKKREETR